MRPEILIIFNESFSDSQFVKPTESKDKNLEIKPEILYAFSKKTVKI